MRLHKNRFFKTVIKLTFSLLILSSCQSKITKELSKEEFIDRIQTYQDSLDFHKEIDNDSSTYNIREYLEFFDKIHMRSGLKCQYYHYCEFTTGEPYFIAAGDSFNIKKYIKLMELKYPDGTFFYWNRKLTSDSTRMARNNMIPEDSEIGYLQYLFFYEMGTQFALNWKSNFWQKHVICLKKDVGYIKNKYLKSSSHHYKKEDLESFEKINPAISIFIEHDRCLITWYEIEESFGIYKRTYSIKRSSPYSVTKINEEEIVQICCHRI